MEGPKYDENGQVIEPQVSTDNQVRELGKDAAGHDISVRKGPYGWYVQQGQGKEAKRTSLPKGTDVESVDIQMALGLLSLPRILGNDPDTNEVIEANIGRFGPYVKRGRTFQSLTPDDNVLTVDLARALVLLSGAKEKPTATVLGQWEKQDVTYQIGKYGPYVRCGKMMASAKKDGTIPTLEEAITLIQNKMREK
jgi:DNA topoisomerase-1